LIGSSGSCCADGAAVDEQPLTRAAVIIKNTDTTVLRGRLFINTDKFLVTRRERDK
jgi:hypothetical protein